MYRKGTIILAGLEVGSNTDILQGTRLQSAPSNGFMTFQLQAADNVVANNYTVSIQLPGGDTPMNNTLISGGSAVGLAGVIDERESLQATFPIAQGGHVVFSTVETGDTELSWRVTFTPA